MSEQQNTQQPVAWIEACDLDEAATSGSAAAVIHGTQPDYEYVPLYTAPPVPRDVLMAFGEAVLVKAGVFMYESDIAALADRYASQVQTERCQCCGYLVTESEHKGCLRAGRAATQPEPVNQQLLAALKMVLDDPDALDGRPRTYKFVMESIAAAEAAQPDHIVDAAKMVHAVPVAIDRATIRQIFMAHGFTIKEGQTDLKPYVYEAAEALLRAQQPASAQPVAQQADWKNFNDGYKAGAEEMRDGLLQLCKDFSDRQNRPYMGDVLAQVNSLCDLVLSEIPRSLEQQAYPPAVAVPDEAVGKLRILLAACNRIEAEAEEFDGPDGLEMGIAMSYWEEFVEALDAARAMLSAAPKPEGV